MGSCFSKEPADHVAATAHAAPSVPAPSQPAPSKSVEATVVGTEASPVPKIEENATQAPTSKGHGAWQLPLAAIRRLRQAQDNPLLAAALKRAEEAPMVQRTSKRPIGAENRTRNIRLFVSSCFLGMGEERSHLMTKTFPVLQAVCNSKALSLVPCDMRWGVKEETSSSGVVSICIGEVLRCPIVVSLLGERYGWEPTKEDLEGANLPMHDGSFNLMDHVGKSITHIELEAGIFSRPPEKRRALVFLRDEDYLSTLPATEQELYRDSSPEAREKLALLKQQLRESGVKVTTYKDPSEIPDLVSQQLLDLILEEFSVEQGDDPMEREWFAHMAFADSRADLFVPFEGLSKLVKAEITCEGPTPNCFYGPSGTGKSSLTAYLIHQLETRPDVLVFAHFIGHSSHSAHFGQLVRRLASQLNEWIGEEGELPEDPTKLINELPDLIARAATANSDSKIFIVLDALNQLQDIEGAKSLNWFPVIFPDNVRVVMSCIPSDPTFEAVKARGFQTTVIPPVGVAERQEMAICHLKHFGKQLEAERLEKIIACEQCSNPMYLSLVLEELRVIGVFDHLDQQIDTLLSATNIAELYDQVLQRLESTYDSAGEGFFPDGTPGLVERTLAYVQCSRHGMTEIELIEALGIPRARVTALLQAIQASLVSQAGLLFFSHQSIGLAVSARYLADDVKLKQVHADLAKYFEAMDPDNPRRCEELPWHLQQAGLDEQLKEFLSSIPAFAQLSANPFSRMELASYWRYLGVTQAGGAYATSVRAYVKSSQAGSLESAAVARLALDVGGALHDWAQYKDAQLFLEWALNITCDESVATPSSMLQLHKRKPGHIDVEALGNRPRAVQQMIAEILERITRLGVHRSDAETAQKYLAKAIAIQERLHGAESLEVSHCMDDLGWICIISRKVQGKDGALEVLKKSIRIKTTSLRSKAGLELPRLELELDDPAWQALLEQAVNVCTPNSRAAREMREASLHIAVNRIAVAYSNLNLLKLSRSLYRTSLTLHENLLGPDAPSIATVCGDIGSVNARAMKCLLADAADKADLGDQYTYTSSGAAETAVVAQELRDQGETPETLFDQAEQSFKRALNVRSKTSGPNHPFYASSLMQYGDLLLAKGRQEDAVKYYRQSLAIRQAVLGDSNPQTKAARRRVERFAAKEQEE